MAVFDKLKRWVEKALEKTQSNDEKVLDEKYQEQLDVEKPPEELFKQNILMGDTARSEIIGQETVSEDTINNYSEDVLSRSISSEQDQVVFPEPIQNEVNIPDFLKQDNNVISDENDTARIGEISFGNVNPISNDDVEITSDATPSITASFESIGSSVPLASNGPNITSSPDPASNANVSPVVDANISANKINESASIGELVGLTAFAFDTDGSDSVTYSLSNNPDNAFAIDANSGVVTVNDPIMIFLYWRRL